MPIKQPNGPIPERSNDGNQDQDLYDIFVAQGIKMAAKIAPSIQGKASIDTLGNALFEIVKKVEEGGAKNGIEFDIPVLLHGSNDILGHLIELSGVDINEEQVKAVVGIAVGRYIQDAVKTGKMTPEQVQQLAQQGQQGMPPQSQQQPSQGGLLQEVPRG